MAKNTYKSNTFKKSKKKTKSEDTGISFNFFSDRRFHLVVGFLLMLCAFFLLVSFISYLFTGKADQSVVESIGQTGINDSGLETENWFKLFGAVTSHYFIFKWFGLASFFIPPWLFVIGYRIVFKRELFPILRWSKFSLFFLIWISVLLGYIVRSAEGYSEWSFLSGGIGFQVATLLDNLMGWGTILLLAFILISFIIYYFDITTILGLNAKVKQKVKEGVMEMEKKVEHNFNELTKDLEDKKTTSSEAQKEIELTDATLDLNPFVSKAPKEEKKEDTLPLDVEMPPRTPQNPPKENKPDFQVDTVSVEEALGDKVENYDPTLDLPKYKYPELELLNEYVSERVQVTKEELEQNL